MPSKKQTSLIWFCLYSRAASYYHSKSNTVDYRISLGYLSLLVVCVCVSVFLSHRRDNVGQCMCMTLPVIILFHPMPSVCSRLPANWKGNERSGVLRTLSNSLTREPSSAQGPNLAIFFIVCRLTSLKYTEHDFFFLQVQPFPLLPTPPIPHFLPLHKRLHAVSFDFLFISYS